MGKDTIEECLEEYEDVFADIFDNLVLKGMGVVKAEDLIARLASSYARKDDGRIRGGMRDVRMENRKEENQAGECKGVLRDGGSGIGVVPQYNSSIT